MTYEFVLSKQEKWGLLEHWKREYQAHIGMTSTGKKDQWNPTSGGSLTFDKERCLTSPIAQGAVGILNEVKAFANF